MGKARTFSDAARESIYQKEFDDEVYNTAAQQNSYNLGSVHFSDQSGIANITQAGTDQRKANLKGALFTGNVGFDLQTAVLDVGTNTIDLLEDGSSNALSLVSTDRIVSLSAGTTADLITILGSQRPGQRLTLYNISGNVITIKHTIAATPDTIRTPDNSDFIMQNTMAINFVFDITTTQWRVVGIAAGSGSGYDTIEDEGVALTQRTVMNFIGDGVVAVDNPGQSRTDITITGASNNEFPDNVFRVIGSADATKKLAFEVDGFTTTTTRTMTPPDTDTVLGGLSVSPQTWTGINTFTGSSFSVTSPAIFLGDQTSDAINFGGRINTNFIPISNSDKNLGASNFQWNTLWIDTLTNATTIAVNSPNFSINSSQITLGDSNTDTISFLGKVGTDIDLNTFDMFNIDKLAFMNFPSTGSSLNIGFSALGSGSFRANILDAGRFEWTEENTELMRLSESSSITSLDVTGIFSSQINLGETNTGKTGTLLQGSTTLQYTTTGTQHEFLVGVEPIVKITADGIQMQGTNFILTPQIGFSILGNIIQDDINGMIFDTPIGDDFTWRDGTNTFATLDIDGLFLNQLFIQFTSIASPGVTGSANVGELFMDSGNSDHLSIIRNASVIDLEAAGTNLLPLNNTWTGSNTFDGSPFIINGAITTLASVTSTSITSPLIVLGDGATDNISFGGQVSTNIVLEEIAEPGNAPVNTGRFYAKVDGGVSVPFWKDEAGTETSMIAAATGANQQLSNLSGTVAVNLDLDPGTTNVRDIGNTTFRWDELFVQKINLSTSAGNGFTTDLVPDSDSNRTLGNATTLWLTTHTDRIRLTNVNNTIFESAGVMTIAANTELQFQIGAIDAGKIVSTSEWDFETATLNGVSGIGFEDGHTLTANPSSLVLNLATNDEFILQNSGTQFASFGETITELKNTNTSVIGHLLRLMLDSSSPADADVVGILEFSGRDSNANQQSYCDIAGVSLDVTNGTEDGLMIFNVRNNGATSKVFEISASGGNTQLGFFGTSSLGNTQPTITGSRGGNAALASLLTALDTLGLITDSTT